MNEAPEESYLFASNKLTGIVERLAGVTIDDKPIVPPADLAFLSHLCAELGALDTMIHSLTYQSLAAMRALLADMIADVAGAAGTRQGYRLAKFRKGFE